MSYNVYRNSTLHKFVILLFVTLLICGCDSHKSDRASLRSQITAIETDLAPLKEKQAKISKDIDTLTIEIRQQSDSLQQHVNRRTKLKDNMALYILDHKLTTFVLAMTVASIGAIVNDHTDQETKEKIRDVGIGGAVVAALYCYSNAEECADVMARLAYYGSEIESENKTISAITAFSSQKESSLQELEKEKSSLGNVITEKIDERDTLQQKHDSLLCSLCF